MIIASLYPCPFDSQEHHDSNAAIIKDGVVYAYEEAKLTGVKSDATTKFPERSLLMGCKELGIAPAEVDRWVLPTPSRPVDLEEQFVFFSSLFKAFKGAFEDFPKWYTSHVTFVDHQMGHAALAVLASPFNECAFICQDGGGDPGDPRNFIFGEFKEGTFTIKKESRGYNNVCAFHAFVTDALGFYGLDNGKTSGLAAYGAVQPELAQQYRGLLAVNESGIDFHRERYAVTELNIGKVNPASYDRNKVICRYPSDTNILRMSLEYLPMDIAATGEHVMREVFIEFLKKLRQETSMKRVVFSGGLFQNVALNNFLLESRIFEDVYIPMAPSDAGHALGQALYVEHVSKPVQREKPLSAFLGPSFKKEEIRSLLDQFRLNYTEEKDIAESASRLIADGKTIGWFQGRAEYGPRSLGARSMLADPRSASSKTRVNQLLKKRDWFMPYAPSIQEEHVEEWIEIPHSSPYMQIAFRVKPEQASRIPAAVHVDGTSRVHAVARGDNESYWRLLEDFRKRTGIPVVLNTSFNRHGIATISTPRQAIEHLLEGCMDYLAIDDFLVGFEENRRAAPRTTSEKSEDILLKEDCIYRLKDVCAHGSEKQIGAYAERLSRLIGVPVAYAEKRLSVGGEKQADVGTAITALVSRVSAKN